MSILKVATAGTTTYFIDTEAQRFLRVKGEQSLTDLWFDGQWNDYINDATIELGKGMYFVLSRPMGAWQATTPVKSITEVDAKDIPAPKE